jgi:hypothetical protein
MGYPRRDLGEDLIETSTSSSTWPAALAEFGIELMVVDLPDDVRERIRAAQVKQFR